MEVTDSYSLEKHILKLGADLVGFADMTGLVHDEWEHLPRGISIAIRLSDVVIDGIARRPTLMYSNLYRSVNEKLDSIANAAASYLEKKDFATQLIPASVYVSKQELSLSHKKVATRGGLGWIGRNSLLVTPQYGPRVRLVSILTNAPFETASPVCHGECGDCSECVASCPSKALTGLRWHSGRQTHEMIDLIACELHIRDLEQRLGAPVCGVCISVCPVGTKRIRLGGSSIKS
ncbi:MAG: 4Fe-4S double cluster binding domain-containing protein [Candidatus Thorarchaeota archaeon]|jgi:epoxyqueuosine reductase QueG